MLEEARALVQRHIPEGYAEFMNWGVINRGIPLEEFAKTHNGQPLDAFKKAGKRLDMGKCHGAAHFILRNTGRPAT